MRLPLTEIIQSWRSALRRPGFLALASATLALGIGACVAVFVLVDAVLLAPPPFPQPERLVVLGKHDAHPWSTISPQQYQLLGGIAGIERLGSKFAPKDINVAGGGEPDLVSAWPVDAGLLPTLGVAPALGRNFSAEEDRPNGPRAAILGYAFWQRHFNGDTGVIGRSVLIDGVATPVVGVLPATFRLDGAPDVLLPLALGAGSRDSATNLLVLARLLRRRRHRVPLQRLSRHTRPGRGSTVSSSDAGTISIGTGRGAEIATAPTWSVSIARSWSHHPVDAWPERRTTRGGSSGALTSMSRGGVAKPSPVALSTASLRTHVVANPRASRTRRASAGVHATGRRSV